MIANASPFHLAREALTLAAKRLEEAAAICDRNGMLFSAHDFRRIAKDVQDAIAAITPEPDGG